MSDVFISYAREDAEAARLLADALQRAECSVWWDRHIPPGKTWDEVIGSALDAAACVVVLWSRMSVRSRWVREEAERGAARNCLVPVLLEKVDPPFGFGRIQTADLSRWHGTEGDSEFADLLAAVMNLVKTRPGKFPRNLSVKPKARKANERASAEDAECIFLRIATRQIHPEIEFEATLFTADNELVKGVKSIRENELDKCLDNLWKQPHTHDNGAELGTSLTRLVLAEEVITVLRSVAARHIVQLQYADSPTLGFPLELLQVANWIPAVQGGFSHRYVPDELLLRDWLRRKQAEGLDTNAKPNVLLVTDPQGDLPDAEHVGDRVEKTVGRLTGATVHKLQGVEATRKAVLALLATGSYSMMHFAGHLFADVRSISRTGILCAGNEILTARDVANLTHSLRLVFFEHCEPGRIRGTSKGMRELRDRMQARIRTTAALGSALTHGGLPCFIGTYWPVSEEAGEHFARVFYKLVIAGRTAGKAVVAARSTVRKLGCFDWSSYVHYGPFGFRLTNKV